MLITWKPRFMRILLEPGDEFAIHSEIKGGLRGGSTQVKVAVKEEPEMLFDDQWLAPWEEWMDEVGFENLWND
jgi:hypothetical protein